MTSNYDITTPESPADYWQRRAREIAAQKGINPDYYSGQIQAESSFDPAAENPSGATGIAQIVPRWHPGVDPNDPEASLNYSADLMKNYLDQYGGNDSADAWKKALVRYNGGGGAVGAWERGAPYSESKQYVDRVFGLAGQGAQPGMGYATRPHPLTQSQSPAPSFGGENQDQPQYDTQDTGGDSGSAQDLSPDGSDPIPGLDELQNQYDEIQNDQDFQQWMNDINQQDVQDRGQTDEGDTTLSPPPSENGEGPPNYPYQPLPPQPSTPGAEGTGGKKPFTFDFGDETVKVPTRSDAADRAAFLLFGKTVEGLNSAEKAALQRGYGKLDQIAATLSQGYKGGPVDFRHLTPADQSLAAAQLGTPDIDPMDNPRFRQAAERAARSKEAEARFQERRKEAIALFNQRRADSWARADTLRAATRTRQLQDRFQTIATREPAPLRPAPAPARAGAGLTWGQIAQTIPTDDLANLVSAWEGGSLGTGAVGEFALRRLAAALPIAPSIPETLSLLRGVWIASGAPRLSSALSAPASAAAAPRAVIGAPAFTNRSRTRSRARR